VCFYAASMCTCGRDLDGLAQPAHDRCTWYLAQTSYSGPTVPNRRHKPVPYSHAETHRVIKQTCTAAPPRPRHPHRALPPLARPRAYDNAAVHKPVVTKVNILALPLHPSPELPHLSTHLSSSQERPRGAIRDFRWWSDHSRGSESLSSFLPSFPQETQLVHTSRHATAPSAYLRPTRVSQISLQ